MGATIWPGTCAWPAMSGMSKTALSSWISRSSGLPCSRYSAAPMFAWTSWTWMRSAGNLLDRRLWRSAYYWDPTPPTLFGESLIPQYHIISRTRGSSGCTRGPSRGIRHGCVMPGRSHRLGHEERKMGDVRIIGSDQSAEWMEVLRNTARHDFYHRPEYHALAQDCGEGRPYLFVYTQENYTIALPLLLRALSDVASLEQIGDGWYDATSVYGYAGPVMSHQEIPEAVLRDYGRALRMALRDLHVLTVFSRLHPLI